MNLDRCYQLLGVNQGASVEDLKTAYRQLARKIHPDLNPQDTDAHQRFVNLNRAYNILLEKSESTVSSVAVKSPIATGSSPTVKVTVTQTKPTPVNQPQVELDKISAALKWQSYEQLKSFLKARQFAQAIAVIDALAQRLPDDIHVRQWQGIVYCQFGRELIDRHQIVRARAYLKKALKIDPHNRELWQQVNQEFSRIERMI